MFRKNVSPITIPRYADPRDFCRIFAEDKTALYLLSLLLTADSEKAQRCYVAGLEDSLRGRPVFREWARSWCKRMVIKNAIRMISPAPGQLNGARHVSDQEALESDFGGSLTTVLQLVPLERFVFVMSVLEGYSIQECSILLNCTKQVVATSQARALEEVALADVNRLTLAVPGREGAQSAVFSDESRL